MDDNPQLLKSIESDLNRQYSNLFHILLADSGHQGLEIIEQLKLRNKVVALFIVDQRMPEMTGVEFLEKTIEYFLMQSRCYLPIMVIQMQLCSQSIK